MTEVIHYAPYGPNAAGKFDCGAKARYPDNVWTPSPSEVTCAGCKAESPGLWPPAPKESSMKIGDTVWHVVEDGMWHPSQYDSGQYFESTGYKTVRGRVISFDADTVVFLADEPTRWPNFLPPGVVFADRDAAEDEVRKRNLAKFGHADGRRTNE